MSIAKFRPFAGRRAALAAGIAASLLAAGAMPAKAVIYHGAPVLPLTVSLVVAGGGPAHFSSMVLYKELTGPLADAETAKLRAQYGDAKIASTFAIFDYAINDVLGIVTKQKIALPPPDPKPGDPKALALALYSAGTTPAGKFDVGYMLERLISHPVHHVIMHDIDYRYSPQQNATFHIVLNQMMHDLAAAYTAPPAQAAPEAPASAAPAAASPAAATPAASATP